MTTKVYVEQVSTVKAVYFGLRAELVTALEAGDEETVLEIREAIIDFKKLADYLVTKTFDATIDFIHTKEGNEAFPNVDRIYQPRGRTAGEKKVVDPFA